MAILIIFTYFMIFGVERIISEIARAFALSGGESGSAEYDSGNIIPKDNP